MIPHSFTLTMDLIQRFTQQPGLVSIASTLDETRRGRMQLSLQILCEQLQRLLARLLELQDAEAIIQQISDAGRAIDAIGPRDAFTHEAEALEQRASMLHAAQFNMVNRVEAFHQHVYVCLSVLGALTELLAPHGWMRGAKRGSVSGLLKFLTEKLEGIGIGGALDRLSRSVHFRSKLVEHCQSHALHSWFTYRGPGGGVFVIYFVPAQTCPSYELEFDPDPYSAGFRLPVGHSSFYPAPPGAETFEALDRTIVTVLGEIGLAAHD